MSGASRYTEWIAHTVTALHATDNDWDFKVTDWDEDERPDLFCINRRGGSNSTEVHILSGASRFGQFILHTGTALGVTDRTFQFALGAKPGPVPRRKTSFDTDALNDPMVYRPQNGTWFMLPTRGETPVPYESRYTGPDGVPADYDGDRMNDLAVWQPSTGNWLVLPSSGKARSGPFGLRQTGDGLTYFVLERFGQGGDVPAPGFHDADRLADFALWRPGSAEWLVQPSTAQRMSWGGVEHTLSPQGHRYFVRNFGHPGALPVAADYDGDGLFDLAAWQQETGDWHILPTTGRMPLDLSRHYNTADGKPAFILQLGLRGDLPQAKQLGR